MRAELEALGEDVCSSEDERLAEDGAGDAAAAPRGGRAWGWDRDPVEDVRRAWSRREARLRRNSASGLTLGDDAEAAPGAPDAPRGAGAPAFPAPASSGDETSSEEHTSSPSASSSARIASSASKSRRTSSATTARAAMAARTRCEAPRARGGTRGTRWRGPRGRLASTASNGTASSWLQKKWRSISRAPGPRPASPPEGPDRSLGARVTGSGRSGGRVLRGWKVRSLARVFVVDAHRLQSGG